MTDAHTHHSTGPSSQHRSLGGIADVIGNAGLFAHGLIEYLYGPAEKKKDAMWEMVSASLLGASGAVAAIYGQEAVPKQFSRLQRKLAEHLELSGAKLEEALRSEFQLNKPVGMKDKIEAFLYNHPSEVFMGASGVAGLGLIRSGFSDRDISDLATGGTLVAAALAANLIPEKTTSQLLREGKDPTSLQGKIEHRPLMLANAIAVTGNFVSAYGAYKNISDGYKLKQSGNSAGGQLQMILGAVSAFSTAGFIAADFLMGTSSKKTAGTRQERHDAQEKMVVSAARMLAIQPPEMQRPLAEAAVAYLTKQPELRMMDVDPLALTQKILDATGKAAQLNTSQGRCL